MRISSGNSIIGWLALCVLAALGILAVALMPGEAEGQSAVDLAGEDMNATPPILGVGEVGWDPVVGRHMSLWSNGKATGTVSTTEPVGEVVLRARGGPGALLFADRFNRKSNIFRPQWDAVSSAGTNRLTTSANYVRKGAHSAKFTVLDEDVRPRTFSKNPRTQLNKEALFCEGDERWIAWSMYFPDNFPNLPSDGWVSVGSLGSAPPYNGDSPFSINLQKYKSRNYIHISRDSTYGEYEPGGQIIWYEPLMRGRWYDWVFHVKFSRNGDEGFVELWKNGQKQEISNGQTKLFYRTLTRESRPHCGNLQVSNYRKKGMFDRLTMYHDEIKVGTSRAAVTR